jgi:hypothetical protein
MIYAQGSTTSSIRRTSPRSFTHDLSPECCRSVSDIVITGRDPVIHTSFAIDPVGGRRVDGRIEVRP